MQKLDATELGLLEAIHESPRSDIPRLVYADWLDEHGQSEYAEFIRLQCNCALDVFRPGRRPSGTWLVGPDVNHKYPVPLVDRLVELVNTNGGDWYEPLRVQCPSRSQKFVRGLPQVAVRVANDAFRASQKKIMAAMRPRHEVTLIVDCYDGQTGVFRSKLFERAAGVAIQAFHSRDLPGQSVIVPDKIVREVLKHRKFCQYSRVQFGLVDDMTAATLALAFPNDSVRSWNHGRF